MNLAFEHLNQNLNMDKHVKTSKNPRSEYTATVLIPIFIAVLMTRQAISPRFAIKIFPNKGCVSMFSEEERRRAPKRTFWR